MNHQILKNFAEFVLQKKKEDAANVKFDGKFLTLKVSSDEADKLKTDGLPFNKDDSKFDLITVWDANVYVYYSINDYVKRYKPQSEFDNIIILIIDVEDNYLLKTENDTSVGVVKLANYDAYKRILDFLLSSASFISYPNTAIREFVLVSEKGVIDIEYNPLDERTTDINHLPELLKRLSVSFSSAEYQGFFRDAIIDTLGRFTKPERFYQMLLSLSVLLDVAERDYQFFIKKFAFDKVKSKFKEERKGYFDEIEKSIDNVNKQVVAFPLTFSASAFAGFQVKDKPFILVLIFCAYAIYTFIAWQVINLSKSNIQGVGKDIIFEAKNIRNMYGALLKEFMPDLIKIRARMKQVNTLICILRFTLIFLLSIFAAFAIYQIFFYSQPVDPGIKPKLI